MEKSRIIDLREEVLADNAKDAAELRRELKEKKLYYLNVMSSPGSGKTTTILGLMERLKARYRIGVMEADIDSSVDADKVLAAGFPAVQLHTGGMCHLSADMSRQGFAGLDLDNLDVVILENVGNLVCPAEFDTGSARDVAILAVPEGIDKPLKYPLMFRNCDLVIVNKIDSLPAFDFDFDKLSEYVHMRNPKAEIIPVSALTGEGMDKLAEWFEKDIETFREN